MNYTVYYKNRDSLFWKRIKNVKGDFIAKDIPEYFRVFILENEERIEIPIKNMIFKFSNERFFNIKKNMEKESGHQMPI